MFSKAEKDHLELVCPECTKNTKVKTTDGVSCSQCDHSFNGLKFIQKTIVKKSAAYLVIAGAIGGVTLDSIVEDERLPYAAEYKLMDTCISSYSGMVDVNRYSDRVEVCSCAIRKAVNSLGVGRDRNEADEVIDAFTQEVRRASGDC